MSLVHRLPPPRRPAALTPAAYMPYLVKPTLPVTLPPTGNWLAYLNYYRATAALPPVAENADWSYGDWLHARYMVKNGVTGHTEDAGSEWYTPEGLAAAQSSNVLSRTGGDMTAGEAIDLWMQAPFHAVGILDPHLLQVGYGAYRQQGDQTRMGAALDVIRGRGSVPASLTFPIMWPSDGTTVALAAYSGGEYPSPITNCPGYTTPTGLPIVLQIGPGNLVPGVTSHSFTQGTTPVEHCLFDETSYTNPDSSQQATGRSVLDARDAIILVPQAPLAAGGNYTASISANGRTYTWSFTVSGEARASQTLPDATVH